MNEHREEQEAQVSVQVTIPLSLYNEVVNAAGRSRRSFNAWLCDFIQHGVRVSIPFPVGTRVRRRSMTGTVYRGPDPYPTPLPGALRADEREVAWEDGRHTIEWVHDLEEIT